MVNQKRLKSLLEKVKEKYERDGLVDFYETYFWAMFWLDSPKKAAVLMTDLLDKYEFHFANDTCRKIVLEQELIDEDNADQVSHLAI
tara:strand:- start:344 stop:604 length:261 start_codon:yes stop_codon:yes gene_type:complete